MPKRPRGCQSEKVVRDGVQRMGGRERQRYRCVATNGDFYRFVGEGALSRTRGDGHSCGECHRPLEVDGGPVVPWRGHYLVDEVAAALWAVAEGVSYTDTAARVRRRAWGHDGQDWRAVTTVASGQTVADWLSKFGSVVAAPHAEEAWPETVVLDSTRFSTRTREPVRPASCSACWPPGATRPVQRRVGCGGYGPTPFRTLPPGRNILAELPGRPSLVVVDRDYGAIGGVQNRWGRGATAVPIPLCEHHLYANGKDALIKAGHKGYGDPLQAALSSALAIPGGLGGVPQAGRGRRRWCRPLGAVLAQADARPDPATGLRSGPLRQRRGRGSAGGGQAHRRPAQLDPSERRAAEPAAGTGPRPLQPHRNRGRLRSRATQEPRRRQAARPPGRDGSPAAQSTRFSSSLRAWVPQQPARHKRTIPAGLKKAPKKAAVTLSL